MPEATTPTAFVVLPSASPEADDTAPILISDAAYIPN